MMFPFRIGSDVVLRFPLNGAADPEPAPPSPIPEGYTALNYIQSSGVQWLTAGVDPPRSTDTVRVELKCAFLRNGEQFIFSGAYARYGQSGYGLYFGQDSAGRLFVRVSDTSGMNADLYTPGNIQVVTGAEYAVSLQTEGTVISGDINGMGFTETIRNNPDLAFGLFATGIGDNYGGARAFASAKIWYCRIYINDVLAYDLLPCKRDSDDKIGMYDTVAEEFRTNGGSGADFSGG